MRFRTLLLLTTAAMPSLFAQNDGAAVAAIRTPYESAKRNIIDAAKVMPPAHYSFKLTPQQRTFSDWIEHTVQMTMRACSSVQGVNSPIAIAANAPKDSLVPALEESFQGCDDFLKSATDAQLLEPIDTNNGKSTRLAAMIRLVAGLNEHYGNLVGYLRTKGITPPSTARAQQQQKK